MNTQRYRTEFKNLLERTFLPEGICERSGYFEQGFHKRLHKRESDASIWTSGENTIHDCRWRKPNFTKDCTKDRDVTTHNSERLDPITDFRDPCPWWWSKRRNLGDCSNIDQIGVKELNVTKDVTKDVTKELTERQSVILEMITEDSFVTIPEMSLKTDIPTIHYFGEKCHRFGEKRFWFGEKFGEKPSNHLCY